MNVLLAEMVIDPLKIYNTSILIIPEPSKYERIFANTLILVMVKPSNLKTVSL